MTALEDLIPELVYKRVAKGLTQADVAEAMGVSQPQVSELETGTHEPLLSTLQRYHRAVTGEGLILTVSRTFNLYEYNHQRVDFCISA